MDEGGEDPGRVVDLNSDLGESYGAWVLGDDDAMIEVVTSANIACGFHAGDPSTLRRTCARAAARGVAIGAQVGYPDLSGFGRRFLDMEPGELSDAVLYQIGALEAMARVAGSRVSYVKPHGALYNAVVHSDAQATAVVAAVRAYDDRLPVVGLPGSAFLERAAQLGLATVREFFADRGYRADGTLLPRREPGAVLHDPQDAAERVARFAVGGVAAAVDGSVFPVEAESICVHGDSPGAVAIARAVRAALERAGVAVRAFAA